MGGCRCGESHQYLPWEPTTNFPPGTMAKCKKDQVVVNTRCLWGIRTKHRFSLGDVFENV